MSNFNDFNSGNLPTIPGAPLNSDALAG